MRVGVIGGGVSGLAAARGLNEAGFQAVVFDTGKRAVGGRSASRLAAETGWPGAVDHAAQFLELDSTPGYAPLEDFVRGCVADGALRAWDDYADVGGAKGSRRLYVGNAKLGMSSLTDALARGCREIRRDVWVPPSNGLRRQGGKWVIQRETFDAVVIAHNGKCAERLTSTLDECPRVRDLLSARFGTKPAPNKMTLNSIYSLLFQVPKGSVKLPGGAAAARFAGDDVVAFLSNNGAKLGWTSADSDVFTAMSTGEFGTAHKHPQEALKGTETEKRVTQFMLDRIAQLTQSELRGKVTATKLQLWGAALPLNRWQADAPFVWDAANQIGIVGDWIGGPATSKTTSSIQAAFISGDALARHVRAAAAKDRGLEGRFVNANTDFSTPSAKQQAPRPQPRPQPGPTSRNKPPPRRPVATVATGPPPPPRAAATRSPPPPRAPAQNKAPAANPWGYTPP
ncbi:hypothetical protein M885DRAFT_614936 [Pelagophyceae sp. CCMP2097]|nr:hypothetical protein M885DRAFT_614936 [Pelagophyceae sp. CCMP2097]